MDNDESVQHKPSQPEQPNPEATSKTSPPSNFLARYAWMLLVVLSAIPLGVVVYAYNQLTNLDDVPQVKHNTTTTSQTTTAPSENNSLPVGMIILTTLGCATGCLVIFRLLKLPDTARQLIHQSHRKQILPPTSSDSSSETENTVGVVQPEETNSQETNPDSLPDLLDIRQQKS
ncbi:MAG TPA: hypothetical protein VK203_15065 [Nostocaceae cyanobacterium]|nr:hypothetical protein [Nostocaceae cyanobacterium]